MAFGNSTSLFTDYLDDCTPMKENPYASPDSEFTKSRGAWVHSRVGWLIALTFLGVLIGASVFAGAFGTSPGDPEGTAMPAGVGGFVGLFFGIVLHRLTRPNRQTIVQQNEERD